MVRPIAPAVLRFTANSNLLRCSIGRSAGFAPRKNLINQADEKLMLLPRGNFSQSKSS
jgi:hypothetical protein